MTVEFAFCLCADCKACGGMYLHVFKPVELQFSVNARTSDTCNSRAGTCWRHPPQKAKILENIGGHCDKHQKLFNSDTTYQGYQDNSQPTRLSYCLGGMQWTEHFEAKEFGSSQQRIGMYVHVVYDS